MDLEGFREVARAERRGNLAHVQANRGDRGAVAGVVALEHDAAAVGQVLEDVRRRVLIDAHDVRPARLHRREVCIRPLAGPA